MDYKSTLNLPQTKFPMKAELPKKEPGFLKDYGDKDIYRKLREKGAGKMKYTLHDGPPYSNGDIHIGHALNKTLKDIVVKYKTMRGFDSAYVPGWDCHGLPIEHQLFKELGITKYQITQGEFRKKAYAYALKYVGIQKEQFKRLGVFGDWENPYLTLKPEYEEAIIRAFGELAKKGYIYRGLKPVNWCYKCETALAEAEVEYEEHTSPSVYVKFPLDAGPFVSEGRGTIDEGRVYLLIWTTTPWTLIANVAVALHPDFTYVYVKTGQGILILAKELMQQVFSAAGIKDYEVIKEVSGRELEGQSYAHPFGLRKGRIVLADYISKEEGSGLVHTAPGHGNEDYATGLKYKLEMVMPVDNKGNFDASAGEFKGLNVYAANPRIIEKLKQAGALLFSADLSHSYPHCWRCKAPIIFRATKQWFLNLEHALLRKKLLAAIDKEVLWVPASGGARIAAMVNLRPDWCLSRQRYWGVPIPALVCNGCKEEFLAPEVIDKYAGFSAKEGSDCWFERGVEDFLSAGFQCPHCRGRNFSKGADILDVWFDSGISSQAVVKKRKELVFPADLYLEGSDQHRGWFQSSLIPGICIDERAPFKAVLTHGFVVDGQGRKMSKSVGNVISPQEIIKDYGADILRLWVASSDYNEDIRISPEILARLSEAYRKIRNTSRFILSNLYDFSPDKDRVDYEKLSRLDKWVLLKLQEALAEVESAYEKFEFYKAYKSVYDFCNEELSMYYLDMAKGRLYTCAADSPERRGAQTAIYEILNALVRLIAPILVFTAEEIWQNMPRAREGAAGESVHLSGWPEKNPLFAGDPGLGPVMELIPDVAKALEEKRGLGVIGSSFDAQIILLTNSEIRYKYLESLKDCLIEAFKVSQVKIELNGAGSAGIPSSKFSEISIAVNKAEGQKCARCWNYSLSVGRHSAHPALCVNCLKAVTGQAPPP